MNSDLNAISPLAAYIGSFMDGSAPAWALILLATTVHWFFLLLPPVVVTEFVDRKLGADTQMRIGPNRASPYGVLQFVANTVKLLFKAEIEAAAQERFFFKWGVIAAIVCVFSAIGAIPLAENWALSNLDSGIIWALFALMFSNLWLFWAAYSVESQWSVLSAFRVLSMISAYLAPAAAALVPPILVAGGPNLDQIVRIQGGMPWRWIVFHDPGCFISFGAFFLALLVWQGRAPFDHFRAEGEINGGLVSEYSGIRKGLLSFLEYSSLFLVCSLAVTTYLGGWQTPFNLESFGRAANLVEWLCFSAKAFALVFLSIWIRWSLPRLRVDQIINLSWRVLVPMGLTGSILAAVWSVIFKNKGLGDFL